MLRTAMVGMVDVPHGTLAAYRRQWRDEVAGRRRRRCRPLERVAVPRVVADLLAVPHGGPYVPQERQGRESEDARADRRDQIERGESVACEIGRRTTRHALDAEDV